ncbi:MAG TPA: hypothetical protein VMW23_01740 [Sedimentisphaerales bacterium]|nr:hypothetical protein [Sedimentisphaerales bacterium]
MVNYQQVKDIESVHGCPFYLFDRQAFLRNYDQITSAFKSRYEKFILAYSYKTNYIPYLCNIIREKGSFAEVVSRLEYDLALSIGQHPSKIIFNGPVKHYKDIELALSNDSIVNLDSWYEVTHVTRYAETYPGKQVKIGIRINIGLSDAAGQSHIQQSLKVGRFGFAPDAENITKLLSGLTANKNVTITSLHGHTSTTDRSIWCYEVITRTLCDIASAYLPETIEHINIGGGIYGYMPPEMSGAGIPSFDDYAAAVTDILKSYQWAQGKNPYLVLEPGVSMTANTLSFVTKVIGLKQIQNKLFVTVDGSAFNTKPTFHKFNHPFEIIKSRPTQQTATYNVVGSTCMEKDYLLTEVTGAEVQEGDYIKINNVGAYTLVLTPPFINSAPAIVVEDAGTYKAVRTRQLLEQMFCNYCFNK